MNGNSHAHVLCRTILTFKNNKNQAKLLIFVFQPHMFELQ